MFDGLLTSLKPRSLFARTAIILLAPILTIQLVVSYVFIQRLYENVTEQMTRSMLPPLTLVLRTVNDADDRAEAEATIAEMGRLLQLQMSFDPDPMPADDRVFYDLSGLVVKNVMRQVQPAIGVIDLVPTGEVTLVLQTRHGPIAVFFDRDRVSASNPHQLLVLMVFVSALVTIVAFLFLKNQVRPIRRLAEAAQAFGKGRVVPYTPSGATEVRLAGRAFIGMRDRIERHIEQRTLMLSGVSHDLRTPLTRMKLALSMMPQDTDVKALARDVDDMQLMLDTFLGFARVDATETPEPVDPAEVAERVAKRAQDGGGTVELRAAPGAGKVALRPLAVERALENLVGNALRHGSRVRVSVDLGEDQVRFRVEDNGPGIPEGQRDEATRPFTRLDPARNLDRGGSVGLGLAIVRDIARQHGGGLILGESADLGGLQADLLLAR